MHVDLGALLAAACAGAEGQMAVANSFLDKLPDLANPEDSSQDLDSSQQLAAEPLPYMLPSYLQARTDLPAGSGKQATPATEDMPLDETSPLRNNTPCLQIGAAADADEYAAGHDSWLHMPSDDEEMATFTAAAFEQPDSNHGMLEDSVEEVPEGGAAAAGHFERDSNHGRTRIPTLQKRRRAFILPDDDEVNAEIFPATTDGEASARVAGSGVELKRYRPQLSFQDCHTLLLCCAVEDRDDTIEEPEGPGQDIAADPPSRQPTALPILRRAVQAHQAKRPRAQALQDGR